MSASEIHPCATSVEYEEEGARFLITYRHIRGADGRCAVCGEPLPVEVAFLDVPTQ